METIKKLETLVASWYKNVPHLPANGQKWLADNAWWIVLVGLIVGVMGIWLLVVALFFASALLVGFGGIVGAAISGAIWIATFIVLLFSIVELILMGLAIGPLKTLQKKGWTLLFVVVLLNVASLAIGFLFKYNAFELVWGLLMCAIGAYFLFEIRQYFHPIHDAKVTKAAEKSKPSSKTA